MTFCSTITEINIISFFGKIKLKCFIDTKILKSVLIIFKVLGALEVKYRIL